jgi:hypothetical protein
MTEKLSHTQHCTIPAFNVCAKFWMASGLHLTPQKVVALVQYFLSVGSSGTFPPGSGSYSGNIEDLLAVILHLKHSFENSLYSPGLLFLAPESGSNLDIRKSARTTNDGLIVDMEVNLMDKETSSPNITKNLKIGYVSTIVLSSFH